ncbi:MAG TPA: hypothetical protein VMS74_10145 [Acidimicrobiia bacterium]|nr:hypothetical protein [Acidimicrobiia bacterium]
MSPRDAPASVANFSRSRRITIRSLATLGLLLVGFISFIVTADAAGITQSAREGAPGDPPPSEEAIAGAEAPGESIHLVGGLALFAIGGSGLIALVAKPEWSGTALQVAAVMTGILITAPIVGDPDNVGGMAGPVDPLFVIVALPGLVAAILAKPWRDARASRRRLSIVMLTAIGAIPIVWYGVSQGLMQRNTFPPSADPHHNAHWWAMSVLVFAGILVLGGAGLGLRGWRVGATAVGLSGVAVGVASLVAPEAASAVSLPWSIASILWGLAVFAAQVRPTDNSYR